MAGRGDVWVFAYGSLMWDPGFAFAEAVTARLWGYHRRFCVHSFVYRGTLVAPGLVLGPDRGGSCIDVAYRIAAANRVRAAAYLAERELAEDIYFCRLASLQIGARRMRGYAFVVDCNGPFYASGLSLEEQLARIKDCRGARGANLDYLLETAQQLTALGIADRGIDALIARLG